MYTRLLSSAFGILLVGLAAWVGRSEAPKPATDWSVVFDADGLKVHRSPGSPASYLLQSKDATILIDAPLPPEKLPAKPTMVLLTHHHRDTVASLANYLDATIPVRAAVESAEWLKADLVAKFWEKSIPLRDSRTAYFVVPTGFDGIEFALKKDREIPLGDWSLTVVPTPGHSRDHLSFVAKKANRDEALLFVGDAVTSTGKLWTPFTTDWDHWTDVGLKPAAESIRALARIPASHLFASRGEGLSGSKKIAEMFKAAADAVAEAARLKSFERFVGKDAQEYDFLVPKEQIASGGDKPWAKVSQHLWITGNTYVLSSKEANACLVVDPWGQRAVDQVAKLRKEENLGPIEVVTFSHAHYDHFDGVYTLPVRENYKVWSLDRVAEPLKEPFKYRAPFLDVRPIAFDKELKDGDTATWREYTFRFHYFPGQTDFACAIETSIDGKRCLFTADNFFHVKQFSGSGGWMGLNRSFPSVYGESAKRVLKIDPEWILAEHGGPYVYNRKDYEQRAAWGEAAGKACDAICVSGNQRLDWNPHRASVEPVLVKAKPGETVKAKIKVEPGQKLTVEDVSVMVPNAKGRHVYPVRVRDELGAEVTDTFFAVDVE